MPLHHIATEILSPQPVVCLFMANLFQLHVAMHRSFPNRLVHLATYSAMHCKSTVIVKYSLCAL